MHRFIHGCIIFASLLLPAVSSLAQPKLVLHGTVTGAVNLALIESNQTRQMLRIGDHIAGYTVVEIIRNGVKLQAGDDVQWLYLKSREVTTTSGRQAPLPVTIKRDLLQNIAQNPQKWLSAIDLEPVIEEGWLSGYRVKAIHQPELVQNLNIQADDIIRSINGIDVRQAKSFASLVKSLDKVVDMILSIERESKMQQIHFSVLH